MNHEQGNTSTQSPVPERTAFQNAMADLWEVERDAAWKKWNTDVESRKGVKESVGKFVNQVIQDPASIAENVRELDQNLRPGERDMGWGARSMGRTFLNAAVAGSAIAVDSIDEVVLKGLKPKDKTKPGPLEKGVASLFGSRLTPEQTSRAAHGVEVVIEEIDDALISKGLNFAEQKLTGTPKVKYATSVASQVSRMVNIIPGVRTVVNPVTIEAAVRQVYNTPVFGALIERAYASSNSFFEHSVETNPWVKYPLEFGVTFAKAYNAPVKTAGPTAPPPSVTEATV